MSDSLWPHGLQHIRPSCPSPTPRVYSNSCPLSRWCLPTFSSSFIPHLLPPSIFPSIRVFSNESVLHIRRPKYWGLSFSISPSNEHSGLISLWWTGWISLQFKGLSRVFSNTTVQKPQFFGAQLLHSPTLASITLLMINIQFTKDLMLPWWLSDKESSCQWRRHKFNPWVRKTFCRRKWQHTPYSYLENPVNTGP